MGSPQPPIVADLYIEEGKEVLKFTHRSKTLRGISYRLLYIIDIPEIVT